MVSIAWYLTERGYSLLHPALGINQIEPRRKYSKEMRKYRKFVPDPRQSSHISSQKAMQGIFSLFIMGYNL